MTAWHNFLLGMVILFLSPFVPLLVYMVMNGLTAWLTPPEKRRTAAKPKRVREPLLFD